MRYLLGTGALFMMLPAMAHAPLHGLGTDIMLADEYEFEAGGIVRVAPKREQLPLGIKRRRSRGPQAKPKRKSNRLTIGKRVRRKHRRAA